MDFFEHQDHSRSKTRQLVLMFAVAVFAIVAVVDLAAALFLGHGHATDATFTGWLAANADVIGMATVVTVLAVLGGSLFRIAALRAGGDVVARGLGATEVPDNPEDLRLKRLRNVVEETALAAGLPVPTLFVLEREDGINAFAAGNTPADAAITVTRGALDQLSRNELQGVIAHEFSHVANGDMRLNLTLMGWLFGILLIALAGRGILRAGARGGSRRNKGGGLVLFGLALVVIGYVGVFAGRLIKAAVSRQRERLADASAVQFTRDTTGLAGALKKIGGLEVGSKFRDTEAEEVSHMLFAPGLSQLFATHPPLIERIRVLEPGFDPREFEQIRSAPPAPPEPRRDSAPGFQPAAQSAAGFVATAGRPEPSHIRAGRVLRERLPEQLREAAAQGDPALVAALLESTEASVRERQSAIVRDWLGEDQARRVESMGAKLREAGPHARLPLLEIAWPGIRRRSPDALAKLERAVRELIQADGKISVFEYVVGRLIRVQLRDLGAPRELGRVSLKDCRVELGDVFAIVADAGQDEEAQARRAYEAGLSRLFPRQRPNYRLPPDWGEAMDRALDRLDRLPSVIKRELIRALATTCAHDGRLEPGEAELLRVICASLHCPLPPAAPATTA